MVGRAGGGTAARSRLPPRRGRPPPARRGEGGGGGTVTRRRTVRVDGRSLTVEDVEAVARGRAAAKLTAEAERRMRASKAVIDRALAEGRVVYGVNTGFGHLKNVKIAKEALERLQRNLVRSHAAGVGREADGPTTRALLLLRANALARGHSGVRPLLARRLLDLIENDLLPVVPESGSVGASGDLAPLAHVALALIGEGYVRAGGRRLRAATALERAGLDRLRLGPREGLALVNGTQFSSAVALLALVRAERAVRLADVSAALSIDALAGTWRAFDPRVHRARPHAGQMASAGNLYRLLQGSEIWRSHADCGAVQDAYSLRCAPQVHGAARDALAELRRVLSIEINASTDNPLVFAEDGAIVSAGNFHAAPVAAAADYASAALAGMAGIVERRIDRLVNPLVSGLPPFLARRPGLESGLMMAQVTAAALASECKTLAHPACADTIPTSALQEDHVSMAPWAARKLRGVVERLETLIAIELLAAVRGLDHRRPLRTSPPLEAFVRRLEEEVRIPRGEVPPGPVIERLAALLREGRPLDWFARSGGLA
ncbi:MAG: histidine ammonia-lyase [Acidobacteria bacterium]|nr:MAG: histidine ammonia-lyase [Acidobacteriota bacterium]